MATSKNTSASRPTRKLDGRNQNRVAERGREQDEFRSVCDLEVRASFGDDPSFIFIASRRMAVLLLTMIAILVLILTAPAWWALAANVVHDLASR
jgi:hypothetical protein